jgi:hypothetical protein
MDQVVTVMAQPDEVFEAVVGTVLVEVVDGEHSRVIVRASFTGRFCAGPQEDIAVDARALFPVRMVLTGPQAIGPGGTTTVITEEELAAGLSNVSLTSVDLFTAVLALLDLSAVRPAFEAVVAAMECPFATNATRFWVECGTT